MAFLSRWPQIPLCTDLAGKEAAGSPGQGEGPWPAPPMVSDAGGRTWVWPVDRLTDEDQRMLWPDEIWPQEIGGLAGPGGRVRVEAVREVIAARLRLVPRFRQLAVRAAARAGPAAMGRRPGLRPRRSCEGGPGPGSR